MTPAEYCRVKVATPGSSFYYSTLYSPPAKTRALYALHAFDAEVNEILYACSDPGVARIKLQWWPEEIQRSFAGSARHPVTKSLTAELAHFNLSQALLLQIVDGTERELSHSGHTQASLEACCLQVAGPLWQLSAGINGVQDPKTLEYARSLGCALELTALIRNVRHDARRGRIRLPAEEIKRYAVKGDDLLSGRSSPAVQKLVGAQIERIRAHYERALGQVPEIDRFRQLNSLILANIFLPPSTR